ncbi:MAG: 4Fe-4S dicluster domain-containing protein [Deltaproteobacteria bacterium]|nr:4Fe-4S dicluster domain-containing protein [Deltaproteobacteria bacterium]MBW2199914.1 4Fe-4S dicluster domain-containing protein [Deltaproteobacteria bacterium]
MTRQTKIIAEENCSGCLSCTLACSFFNTPEKVFNPSRAHVYIERKEGQNTFEVNFKEDCIDCGTCAEYCHYGVISVE